MEKVNTTIHALTCVRCMQISLTAFWHEVDHRDKQRAGIGITCTSFGRREYLGSENRQGCGIFNPCLPIQEINFYSMDEGSCCDERCPGTTRFESMLRLLLFMEAELEFKEEVIDLLLEDEQVQDILNKKLIQLNRRERGDPALALSRDHVYDKELWEMHFENWHKSAEPCFEHVVSSNAGHLGAVAAMRTIGVASKLHHKYINTYRNLEKAVRSYKKLKYKFSRQQVAPQKAELPNATHDTLAKLEKLVNDLQEEITLERKRNISLEKKIKTLTSTAAKERKKCMKVIRLLAERIERLNAPTAHTSPKGHRANGKHGLNAMNLAAPGVVVTRS